MAYEKQTWTTGEVITQEKLNHMEDGIEDAYELPTVSASDNGKFLGVVDGVWSVVNGGGGDTGYECTETVTELFNETVTTAKPAEEAPSAQANLAYSESITADTLTITFDGVEYTCPKQSPAEGVSVYGDLNFSQIPFYIASSSQGNLIFTQNAGEYAVKAELKTSSVTSMTPCFISAVSEAARAENLVSIARNADSSYSIDASVSELSNYVSEWEEKEVPLLARYYDARLNFLTTFEGTMGIRHYVFGGICSEDNVIKIVTFDISATGEITKQAKTITFD